MASIVAALDAMQDEAMLDNATMIGEEHLRPGLADLATKHPVIGEVRGLGCFFALELVSDPESRKPLDAGSVLAIKAEILSRGLLPFAVDNRIHVVPPLIVAPTDVSRALAIYDEALTATGF
jgi:taurine--2-oxoglutarate transaminase